MPPTQHPVLARPDGSPIRAVVADDETLLADLLSMALSAEGWQVRVAHHGMEALTAIRQFDPDVVVLDVMMPIMDGMEVLDRLRSSGNDVPVLFLTAKDALSDRIAGIQAGGDDYVTKPFSLEEVIVRLKSILRRTLTAVEVDDDSVLTVGNLTLDTQTHEVLRAGIPIDLTATEFNLLTVLMENPRVVISKERLLQRVWGYDFGGKNSIVELYISYLRKKVDVLGEPMIHTVRGSGYVIRPADSDVS